MSRIDIIGQNGNDGEHYLVEAICRVIAGEHADMKLMGNNSGKVRWQLFIPQAIKILEVISESEGR